jgi:hypothetical protein
MRKILGLQLMMIIALMSKGQNTFLLFVDNKLMYDYNFQVIKISHEGIPLTYSYKFPSLHSNGFTLDPEKKTKILMHIIVYTNSKKNEFNLEIDYNLLIAEYFVLNIYTKEMNKRKYPFEDKEYLYDYNSSIGYTTLAKRGKRFHRGIFGIFKKD